MNIIDCEHISKEYIRYKQSSSFLDSIAELFNRNHVTINAVNDINFKIEEGEKVGLLGPNGSGKTTTMKMLSGILNPTHGALHVAGHIPFKREYNFLKKISLIMGQKSHLWWDLPALDTFFLMKRIYEIPESSFKKKLTFLVEGFQISHLLNVQVRRLSLGERMKMEIISMLLHDAKLLLLDEPTIGLDFEGQNSIRSMLNEYNKQFNATILLTSHYLADVTHLCKRIIVIHEGLKIYDGSLEYLKQKYSSNLNLTIKVDNGAKVDWSHFGNSIHIENNVIKIQIRQNQLSDILEKLRSIHLQQVLIEEPSIEDALKELFYSHPQSKEQFISGGII